MPIATLHASTPLPASRQEAVASTLRQIHLEGDKIIRFFIGLHCVIALCLAPFYDTWTLTLGVGGLAAGCSWPGRTSCPGLSSRGAWRESRCKSFTALHIYQLHGLAEMHFFFFTAFTVLIVYRDWVSLWPGRCSSSGSTLPLPTCTTSARTSIFSLIPTSTLRSCFFHFGIALGHVALCGYWAARLRRQSIFQTNASTNSPN
jgi:methyl-accepting chemotaxis protein